IATKVAVLIGVQQGWVVGLTGLISTDSEQRIVASKVIKRFLLHTQKTAFVVEHDFIMATYLADRVIVYEGQPSIDCIANAPQSLLTGMNLFLSVSAAINLF
ncbi:RNase L inhibitor protein, partial [Tanacetum coccineum]